MDSVKPQKFGDDEVDTDDQGSEVREEEENSEGEYDLDSESDGGSPDTEDEIAAAKRAKSTKTLKRKRRATEPSHFGATLESLLNTDVPSTLPLSLKPSVARKRNDEKLELRAKKVLRIEKKEKEDKGRITDVIGGWGGASERELRKVAQRGVVKLFNVIQQSQLVTSASMEDAKTSRGTGKPTLPAPTIVDKRNGRGKNKNKNNAGTVKESAVDQDDFFDIIRSGGIVSKA